MSDAYSEWLNIPAHLRPPTHYQLLGIAPSELDPKSIARAADDRLATLYTHSAGPRADECARITREVVQARDVLIDPVARHRYDAMTPDAAAQWWQPDSGTPPPSAAPPVEGWWQGEAPDPDLPLQEPVTSAPPPELPAPVATKDENWWKAPGEVDAGEPPVVRPAPPPPPVVLVPLAPPPSPPTPIRPPETPSAPGPLIRESTLALTAPEPTGSPIRWMVVGLVALGVVGVGVVYLTRPWDRSPDDPKVAGAKPKPDPGPVDPPETDTPIVPKPVPSKDRPAPVDPELLKPIAPIGPPPGTDPKPPAVPTKDTVEAATFRGHMGGVYGLAVTRTGKTILSVSDDRSVLHYSPQDKDRHGQIHRLGSPGIAIALCNGDKDAVFCDGGDLVVFDMAGQKVRATFENPRGGIRSLAPAPDASFVLTGATDGCVRWWDTRTKKLEHTLDVDEKAKIGAVAIDPGAGFAAVGLSDGKIAVWDLKTRRETKRWPAHKSAVTVVSFSPDGQTILSAGDDGIAAVWQRDGKLVRKLTGHDGAVTGAGWTANGHVVTAGIDRTVRRWTEADDWKTDWTTKVPDKVYCLAVDARDRFVLVGRADGAVQLVPLPRVGS